MSREFFSVRRVSEALTEFRPRRRVKSERIGAEDALGRIPAEDVIAPGDLPGFARATVDGFAVRAADTFGADAGLPSYLEVVGEIRMGSASSQELSPGTALSTPTGGALPAGADAVVMVEHTQETAQGTIEVTRPVAPGDGLVRDDEDVAQGATIAPAGRSIRAQDLALLAAAGVTELDVMMLPRVSVISTGDEVVPATRANLEPGYVRDATAPALAALVAEAGGRPALLGIVPDDPSRLREVLTSALESSDVVVVSAGSSVGARDETASVVASLGEPGIWCHGLSIKPGKPTLLAECDGIPLLGLPGNPLSALVVFRLLGMSIVRAVGGWSWEPPVPTREARLERDLPSVPGRLDVAQVRLAEDVAQPLFGQSALLSVLAGADGYVVVPEEASGLYQGDRVEVVLYR